MDEDSKKILNIVGIIINENENNSLISILQKCIITSVLCCIIILCIVFI